ncbi:MAG: WecB/TagA/CpsF family glycosyltransferase [Candidatus Contendobacter sp.]|nr:WecB/TagA/CpsF family glycosyltransferase [Candidatus Contendobacter sp.]
MNSYHSTNAVTLVLGVPIDDLTLESAVQQTLALADAWRRDGRPRQIATVNVDFLTNALGWTSWAPPRHPELLDILRRADRVTADGMPVVWLARILGTPLSGRVTGADLVPALASAMARTGHRLFLLGGRGDIGQQAADQLRRQNPGLQIAGVYSPFVHTEGEAALNAETDDVEIVERINRAAPDVLLVGFGNPKQELWFHRNRHQLKAGVSIGIGGTFEFIVGRVARAPEWMQRSGLEWIYRITQDPGRLWKRYAVGLLKLAVMGMPMALHYRWRKWRCPAGRSAIAATLQPSPPSSPSAGETMLVLPERVDAAWVQAQAPLSVMSNGQPGNLAVDFTAACFIDAAALGYLVRLWKSAQTAQRSIRAVGIEQAPVAGLLKATRAWDLFAEVSGYPLLPSPVATSSAADGLLILADPVAGVAIAGLNGRLDVDRAVGLDVELFAAALGDGDCVLDLSGLRFVDSTGLRLLFHLQRRFNNRGRELILCGVQPPVRQLLAITCLTDQFHQATNREQALGLLAARQRETDESELAQDYRASASCLDRVLRKLYVVAYRAEIAVNFLIRPRVDGAYVAVWHGDQVLLILNSYKSRYTLPCGKVRPGEDPLEAARRELREEIGLDLESGAFHQSFTMVDHSEFKEDHIHLYETRLEQLGKIRLDGREVVWAGFRTPAEAVALPLFPPVQTYLLGKMNAPTDRK